MNLHIENTSDGRRLVVSRAIDAPIEIVWEVLTDTHRWPEWGPSVAAVDCEDRFVRTGSHGRIRTVGPGTVLRGGRDCGGLWLPFHVTGYDGRRWTWTVAGFPATGHRVEPTGKGCRAVFEVPPFAAAYTPVCWRALEAIERLARETE